MGVKFPFFRSLGPSPDCHGFWSMMESSLATTSASSLRTLGCISSGPSAGLKPDLLLQRVGLHSSSPCPEIAIASENWGKNVGGYLSLLHASCHQVPCLIYRAGNENIDSSKPKQTNRFLLNTVIMELETKFEKNDCSIVMTFLRTNLQVWEQTSRWPCLGRGMNKMTSRGPFQSQPFSETFKPQIAVFAKEVILFSLLSSAVWKHNLFSFTVTAPCLFERDGGRI